jgi:hypothetical protein
VSAKAQRLKGKAASYVDFFLKDAARLLYAAAQRQQMALPFLDIQEKEDAPWTQVSGQGPLFQISLRSYPVAREPFSALGEILEENGAAWRPNNNLELKL